MTQLIDLPGNKGHVFSIDPHKVSAVQPYEGELAGRTGKHPLSVVWVEGHNLFVCAWPMEQTVAHLNEARQSDAAVFASGFWAGGAAVSELPEGEFIPTKKQLEKAWKEHIE